MTRDDFFYDFYILNFFCSDDLDLNFIANKSKCVYFWDPK